MVIKRKNMRSMPALNTTSTADISFMLLIFFLMVSSMDLDKGLARQLPPADKPDAPQQMQVQRDRVLEFVIDANDQLLVDGKPMPQAEVQRYTEEFIARVGKEHLLSVEAHPQSTYNTYFTLQNTIVAAYRNVRNRTAQAKYGKPLKALTDEEQLIVRELVPQRVAEKYNTQKGGEQ